MTIKAYLSLKVIQYAHTSMIVLIWKRMSEMTDNTVEQ
jgi:hypothetical protein